MSFLAYANDALVINQWGSISNIECEQFSRCLSTGENVLDYLHIRPVSNQLVQCEFLNLKFLNVHSSLKIFFSFS
jgi:hypothetical protein